MHYSFPELQENVIKLYLRVNMTVKMKCFENYSRLTYIYLKGPYDHFENLTSLVCYEWNKCYFTLGLNGLRCPTDCDCFYHINFKVRCSFTKRLTQIPPLPIPSDYQIFLLFSENDLRQLPNNTLPGYMEVVSLDVSKNKITSLAIHQLPMNLNTLDISNNPIKTVDIEVADFLSKVLRVAQKKVRWIANCEDEYLLAFFKTLGAWENIYFGQLNGTCPDKCICCFDRITSNFLINCTNIDMKYPELPSHIPNNVTLLLANCGIRKLPSNLFLLLKTQNMAHLDLRNNRLRSLDDKTVLYFKNGKATIELSGNPFDCHCKTSSLLSFLKNQKPSEYSAALARCKIPMCPDSCVCCLVNLNSSALAVDCKGQRLTRLPHLPGSVSSLDLRNNNITEIILQSQEFLKNMILSTGLNLFLSGNPWACICDENNLVAFAKSISQFIPDFAKMECINLGKALALVEDGEICPSFFIYPLMLFVFSLIVITALNAFVYFKQPILMWFYEHEICMSMAVRLDLDIMKKFDAFLCFTHKDEQFVEEYVERLENGQRKFRLCFYLRDWNVGASIPECIIQSVKDSRRIIILMTKHFLESTWGKLEFRLALHATSKDRCKRLIVILYPDVENFDDLDSELKAYMVLNTYLRRDSPNFWNKLLYSMPHIS
ncbi:hypothetical protein KR054_006137 [Drosophila jambulina]|nr:hypothetical protein KR054_006137 [Drosophila jambulina]